jgi:uncharacterized membrane protein
MHAFYLGLLGLHIAAGALTLLLGIVIGVRRKADAVHRRLGRAFVHAMLVVCGTSVIMAAIRPNPFLLLVAVFSGYQSAMGRRTWTLNSRRRGIDVAMAAGLVLVGMSQLVIAGRTHITDVILPLFFAVLIIGQGGSDLLMLLRSGSERIRRRALLVRHISQMGGAMIASWTAFLIQNTPPAFEIVAWILPTVVGSWYIARSIRRHTAAIDQSADRHTAHANAASDPVPAVGHHSVGG